ncbi:MAG: ABC transporter permease, partial [Chloroflexota bacterium]
MTFGNMLSTAFRAIANNKLRATLTMLGIIIGVASVIATLALGNGARAAVESDFRFLGSDQIQIDTELKLDKGQLMPAGKPLLYEDGLGIPDAAPLIDRVEMSVRGAGKVRHGTVTLDMAFQGTDADALVTLIARGQVQPVNWKPGQPLTPDAFIGRGRFYSRSEVLAQADVCVLGYQTAEDLFQGDDPIGATVWIKRKPCEVIGVIAELETTDPAQQYTTRPNDGFYLPISTAVTQLFDKEQWITILAHVSDQSRVEEAKKQIADYLRARHDIAQNADGKYTDDFRMTTKQDVLGAQQDAARTFSLLLTALATVSLMVGGIGIMNVMLVSVTERTREIGLRKAVGAKRFDIVAQFLWEAILLSAVGGILGIAVGVLAIPLAA